MAASGTGGATWAIGGEAGAANFGLTVATGLAACGGGGGAEKVDCATVVTGTGGSVSGRSVVSVLAFREPGSGADDEIGETSGVGSSGAVSIGSRQNMAWHL